MKIHITDKYVFLYAEKDNPRATQVSHMGRWNKPLRCWYYPLTLTVCLAIQRVFPETQIIGDNDLATTIERLTKHEQQVGEIKEAAELPQPEGISTPLWLHQKKALELARHLDGCMLALDMGTGKSLCVISLISSDDSIKLSLIVCPKSVQAGWEKQFKMHCEKPISVKILTNNVSYKADQVLCHVDLAPQLKKQLVIITNYESTFREPLADVLLAQKWDLIVCDEAHKIKSPGGRTSRYFAKLGKTARKRICLTGTPLPNSIIDAYGQYRFMAPGVFGTSVSAMRNEYCEMGGFRSYDKASDSFKPRQVIAYKNADKFNTLFYSCAYRVMADDVLDLPPVIHTTHTFDLSDKARKIYKDLKKDLIAQWEEGQITAANGLVKLLRLSQLTGGWAPLDNGMLLPVDTGKQELLAELLDDISVTDPVVIFARFTQDIRSCIETIKAVGRTVGELSGHENDLMKYQTGEINTLVVQIQSGGVGVELQKCGDQCTRYCFYYSVSYSLTEYEQSLARIHRPGQEKTVNYFHLVAERTIDSIIYAALAEKKDTIEEFLKQLKEEA